ncbi:TATA box-binding protein-associated factor RNA polymerase I subunit B-like [Carex rostrata]
MANEGTIRHFCEICRNVTDFEGEVGFLYCLQCGSQTQDIIATDVVADDMFAEEGGGLYSQTLHRRAPPKQEPEEILDFDGEEKPRVFGSVPLPDIETVAGAIRARYVEGLQLMLRRQCEVLVETFNVSPLIGGMAPSIWLRHVSTTGVFKEGWVASVIANCKDRQAKRVKEIKKKRGQRKANITFILRTLRKTIPIYSTLAISFLSCHLAREPVLPTDIIDWALEAKLPYLSFFHDMDKYIGTAPVACPLKNRTMFRPTLLLGSCQLEVVVGKIAEKIGLNLPPVNFYAVARRWLEELTLPMKILPHACRVYEWLLPAELWISGNDFFGFPTRVVVMSVLIITLRILYNINGYGTWEESLSNVTDKQGPTEDVTMESNMSSVFDARELLRVLSAVHEDIEVKHDYPKDLNSYLKYCKDVISVEMTPDSNLRVNRTIDKCWNIYNKSEDSDSGIEADNLNFEQKDIGTMRYGDDATNSTSFDSCANLNPSDYDKKCSSHKCVVDSSFREERELDKMRFEMEQNWFVYLAPVTKRKSKGYISYRRVNVDKILIYAVHADYYILLRTLAKVVRVDMKLLHASTLELERKLAWIEEKIRTSLNVPKGRSEGGPVEHQEFELD